MRKVKHRETGDTVREYGAGSGVEAFDTQVAVIVACGGVGTRFYQGVNMLAQASPTDAIEAKQFITVAGKPVLAHTLDVLEKHPGVGFVLLLLPGQFIEQGDALVKGRWQGGVSACYHKVKAILAGGKNRQASVEIGLAALTDMHWEGPVLIQDGVRPCTTQQVYDRVISGVRRNGNAVAAIPVRDTIKRSDSDGHVLETLNRQNLWQIQTPQGFWMADLREAYAEGRRRGIHVTDDAALMEALGKQVYLVEGDPSNMKLTYPEDQAMLEALLRRDTVPEQVYMQPDAGHWRSAGSEDERWPTM